MIQAFINQLILKNQNTVTTILASKQKKLHNTTE